MKYLSRNAEKANGTVTEFSIYMTRSADITVTSEESEFNRILCKTNKQTNKRKSSARTSSYQKNCSARGKINAITAVNSRDVFEQFDWHCSPGYRH